MILYCVILAIFFCIAVQICFICELFSVCIDIFSGSSGSSGKGNKPDQNSRFPPGDKEFFGPQNWAKVILFFYPSLDEVHLEEIGP